MRIEFDQIWNFFTILGGDREDKWSYTLVTGGILQKNLSRSDIINLQRDHHFDTELLPSLFTYREILWQPDVFSEARSCLSAIRILKSFCEEYKDSQLDPGRAPDRIYAKLLTGMIESCDAAVGIVQKERRRVSAQRTLATLRKCCFPIVKFFIYHPKNRPDYQNEALNRLNYAFRIFLTQLNGKYEDFKEPQFFISRKKVTTEPAAAGKKEMKLTSNLMTPVEEVVVR